MSDDYKKDNLENFFKSTFDEQSNAPAENGWDLPSTRVWEGVDANLHPKGSWRGGLIWWLLGIGLLVITGWTIFWSVNRTSSGDQEFGSAVVMEERMEKGLQTEDSYEAEGNKDSERIRNDAKVTENNATKANLTISEEKSRLSSEPSASNADFKRQQNNPASETTISPSTTNRAKASDTSVSVRTQREGGQENSKTIPIAVGIPANNKNNNSEDSPLNNKEQELEANSEGTRMNRLITEEDKRKESSRLELQAPAKDTLSLKRKIVRMELLRPLVLKTSLLTYDRAEKLPAVKYEASYLITPTAPKIAGFYVGLESSILESYRTIIAKGDFLIPRFYEEEQPDISLGYGLNIGYQLSRNWSIESGFNYTSSALRFRSRRQIRYTMVDEQPNDAGEFQRNYDFAFDTSNGTIDSDVAIARSSGTSVAENDFIGMTIVGKQNFSYLNVPVLARYHIGKGPWQIGLKAGLINQFLLNASFQFESISIARPGVRLVLNERFFRKRTLENVNTYQADFEVGAALRFFATDQLWIYAEPTYRRSINPSHENLNFKTFPTVKGVEIGLNWRF